MDYIEFTAFNIGTEDVECYSTVMLAKEMVKIATVSRIDKDPENGYQRHLDKKRVKEITSYINDGNIIPGSIILSVQKGCNINYEQQSKKLRISLNEGMLLFVIDGQHRLYGASYASRDVPLPVCIFTGLDTKQEVQYFLDINSYQRGVTKTLRIELLKFISEPETKDAIRNRLFNELNEEITSPLYNKMSPTVTMSGKLSHVPFQDAIEPLLDGQVLKKCDYETKKIIIINYLLAFETILKKMEGNSNRMTNSIFFQAIFKIFEEVCSLSIFYFKNYKESSFIEILDILTRLDFSRHTGSNNQVKNAMIQEMRDLLEMKVKMLPIPDDLFL